MRVKQQAALSDTRPLRLPEPTAQPAGPVRSRSAPSPRLCHASRLCVSPRAPRGAAACRRRHRQHLRGCRGKRTALRGRRARPPLGFTLWVSESEILLQLSEKHPSCVWF